MAPATFVRAEDRHLVEEFFEAIYECNLLESIEIETLAQGVTRQLEEQIREARRRRERAKDAIIAYQELHGG